MKVFFVKNSDSKILYRASTEFIGNRISKPNAQQEASIFAGNFLKGNPELKGVENLYVYCSNSDDVIDTASVYIEELIIQAAEGGKKDFCNIARRINFDDRLNSREDKDIACMQINSHIRLRGIKFKPNKIKLYVLLAAGLSKFSKMSKKSFRKNIYWFLNDLLRERGEDDVVLIFAPEEVFKAMQKYPELHQFCYFGDEKIFIPDDIFGNIEYEKNTPDTDMYKTSYMVEDCLKSKKTLKIAQPTRIIIENQEVDENNKLIPVYLKYAKREFVEKNKDNIQQRGE